MPNPARLAANGIPRNAERLRPMPDQLSTQTIDQELIPGARNAIRDCLRLKPEERITIITDEATQEIAAAGEITHRVPLDQVRVLLVDERLERHEVELAIRRDQEPRGVAH